MVSQYPSCWWPSDARSQGISNHNIDFLNWGNPIPIHEGLTVLHEWLKRRLILYVTTGLPNQCQLICCWTLAKQLLLNLNQHFHIKITFILFQATVFLYLHYEYIIWIMWALLFCPQFVDLDNGIGTPWSFQEWGHSKKRSETWCLSYRRIWNQVEHFIE